MSSAFISRGSCNASDVRSFVLDVPRLTWTKQFIRSLRVFFHYVVLLALAIAQVVIAHVPRLSNNKGINYAVIVGVFFTGCKILSVATGKAEHLLLSVQGLSDDTTRKGTFNLEFLPNINNVPTAMVRYLISWIRKKIYESSFPKTIKFFFTFICVVPFWLLGNSYVAALSVWKVLLFIIDTLSIFVVETILILVGENISWMPALSGKLWAYLSLISVLLVVCYYFAINFVALISFLILRRKYSITRPNEIRETLLRIPKKELYSLLRFIPETVEDAVSTSLYGMRRRNEHIPPEKAASYAPLYQVVIEANGSDAVTYDIVFSIHPEEDDWHALAAGRPVSDSSGPILSAKKIQPSNFKCVDSEDEALF